LLTEKDEVLKCSYEWQVGDPKSDSWAGNLSDELEIALGHVSLDRDGRDLKNRCQIIKTRRNDIKRRSNRERMKCKMTLVSYQNIKEEWEREIYMYIYVIRMKEMGKDDLDWEFRN
jgi:hypothetical protein